MWQCNERVRRVLLVISNLLLPAAVLTFASGFFPYKPMSADINSWASVETSLRVAAPFDKVIFMVVDALRSDFVYGHGTGFEFTQSLIRAGAGIPFTARATPPTVTMPRIKALTTGSVPSFLDLVLNFAESDQSSSLAGQDTWLRQLRERPDGKLVFYGDDTWLKLFPNDFFARHDGTSSFFVSDFTEVDHNVTRHVPKELANADWNAMIMHYLGMDHIGHKTGPQGPSMIPKQKEMDSIVQMVYEALESQQHHSRTLFVLAGDHGMNAGGNHGGSGPGETEPALLFISPVLKSFTRLREYECPTLPKEDTQFHFYTKLEQSDVVPTLSALLGLPVPLNSLGVCSPELMGFWSVEDQVKLLNMNAAQLRRIVLDHYGKSALEEAEHRHEGRQSCNNVLSDLDMLACKLRAASHPSENNDRRKRLLLDALYAIQEDMSSTASSYNIPKMVAGIAFALASLLLAVLSLQPRTISMTGSIFFLLIVLYGIMMFASSYVEEEQHFWYWMSPAWFAALTIQAFSTTVSGRQRLRILLAGIVLLASHRLSISWNQTGQKHAGEPDIAHTVFPEHHILMWTLVLGTYLMFSYRISTTTLRDLASQELAAILGLLYVLPAIIFKLNFTQADAPELVRGLGERLRDLTQSLSLVVQARIVFLALASLLSIVVVLQQTSSRKATILITTRLQPILSVFLATQTRASNVPLLLLMDFQASMLQLLLPRPPKEPAKDSLRAFDTAVTVLLLAHTTYYCFGGSNSISTLDLSHAYNGVADYNILAVGILLFAGNWTGPVWWAFTSATRLMQETEQSSAVIKTGARSWVHVEREKLHADAVAAVRAEASRDEPAQSYAWLTYMSTLTVFFATSLVAVMAACTALRTHLFVWSVFSPKYLYAMAWSTGWHLLVNGIVCTSIWFVSS